MQVIRGQAATFVVSLGPAQAGLATVGYTLKNPNGSTSPPPAAPRTTAGVVEDGGGGNYHVTLTLTALWTGVIYWDAAPGSPISAEEDVEVIDGSGSAEQATSAVAPGPRGVGGAETPREIRRLRKNVLDYHRALGQSVVVKRRLTTLDVEKGEAVTCPYHNDPAYEQSRERCPYCFGTNILGGFADGTVTSVAIGDAQTDLFRLSEQGLFMREQHPQATAPWFPTLHDGDLIIAARIAPDGVTVLETGDRFELDEVTPVRPRGSAPLGFASRRDRGRLNFVGEDDMLVSQSFQVDFLPPGHIFYDVPVDFDAAALPPAPAEPEGGSDDGAVVTERVTSASLWSGVRGLDDPDDVDVTFPPEYS